MGIEIAIDGLPVWLRTAEQAALDCVGAEPVLGPAFGRTRGRLAMTILCKGCLPPGR